MSLARSLTPDERWQQMISAGRVNAALQQLMGMIGLEEVKTRFMDIMDEIKLGQYCNTSKDWLSTVFHGNPGTGKTTVARIYSSFLDSLDVFGAGKRWIYKTTSGSLLAAEGIHGLKDIISEITDVGVGVLFIDDVHQLLRNNNTVGAAVLDYLATTMQDFQRVIFVFAGYESDMERLYGHSKSFRHQIGSIVKFNDYDEDQIRQMLSNQLYSCFGRTVEWQACDLQPQDPDFLLKVVARKIARGGGVEGFCNAWVVKSTVANIKSRHRTRLQQSSTSLTRHLTQEDLLGPGYDTKFTCKALDTLNGMIGLEEVKRSAQALIHETGLNKIRELMGSPPVQQSLNKVFLGNPGTGKTTVAQLYGQILVELGMLSNGEVIVKTPSDFIADHAGGTEKNTKKILESAKGKVLVIDEAYGLGAPRGASGARSITDPYKSAVIDTLVANVQSRPGDDQCILLLGYKDKMEEMYQDANPGLNRRFPLESAFVFEDFTPEQLRQIWEKKLNQRGLHATDEAERIAMEILERRRHKLNFGNAGEVNVILDAAQQRFTERIGGDISKFGDPIHLEPADVDPDYQRLAKASIDIEQLFTGIVGCDEVKETVRKWPTIVTNARRRNLDLYDVLPMTFTFTGPPGTGKTTTAKNIGTVLYSLGLLASSEVNVISATELVGEYVGQTGPKVRRQFEASLGKVLFIDEAYRLSTSSHHFGQDAIDEIVTCLTEDKFRNHLVVIFAGYEDHIKHLLNKNPGLDSRVPGRLRFPPLTKGDAIELLSKHLNKDGFSAAYLRGSARVNRAMISLVGLSNWASGRSVENLSRDIKNAVLSLPEGGRTPCLISEAIVLEKMGNMRHMLLGQLAGQGNNRGRPSHPESPSSLPPPLPLSSPPAAMDMLSDFKPKVQTREDSPPVVDDEQVPDTNIPAARRRSERLKRKREEALSDEDEDSLDVDTTTTNTKTMRRERLGRRLPEEEKTSKRSWRDSSVWRWELERQRRRLVYEPEFSQRSQVWKLNYIKQREEEVLKEWEALSEAAKDLLHTERQKELTELREKRAHQPRCHAKEVAKMKGDSTMCCAGYSWIDRGNGWYQCAGGSHWARK
ncbi:P-loop containing nucleoside triphosphate hydrolase protein [Nemania sp. NC0429]|nr:P-loop containing nucleoside triphosphate hydrolase protein [Nemania sp. NC0429]